MTNEVKPHYKLGYVRLNTGAFINTIDINFGGNEMRFVGDRKFASQKEAEQIVEGIIEIFKEATERTDVNVKTD